MNCRLVATIFQTGQQHVEAHSSFLRMILLLPALGRVSAWATGHNYERAAIATFLQVADYWLVAHALAHGQTVVTHEVPSESVRKIKIPNACTLVSRSLHQPLRNAAP